MRIFTLTLNPAFDVHARADRFALYKESVADIVSRDAGGKGVNISRALTAAGAENEAIVWVGKENGSEFSAMLDKATYTIACRSAIKAHQSLSLPELEKLYAEASALEGITTCPHGRPITVKLTRYQIEKMFGRIV